MSEVLFVTLDLVKIYFVSFLTLLLIIVCFCVCVTADGYVFALLKMIWMTFLIS